MRQPQSWARRLRGGLGVTSAALLVVVGAPVAAQTVERAPSPAQDEPVPDPQSIAADPSFAGYVGYTGSGGIGAPAAADDDGPKPEGLGPVGTNSPQNEDVPGQPVAEASDSASVAATATPEQSPDETAAVRSAIAESGSARVIVTTRTTTQLEADLSAAQVEAQRDAIVESLDGLQATLKRTGSHKVFEFEVVPSAVYEVTAEGLDALLADPDVASVVLDGQVEAVLASSTGVIDSDLLNAAGVLGNNFDGSTTGRYDVAIIDSGVDSGHSAFTGRIVRQACFVTNFSCPGATNTFIGAPGGEECAHSVDCDHGTHVGGTAAGEVFTGGHEGVARGAGIVAINVAQDNPASTQWTAFFSSIDSALQHVLSLKNTTNRNLVAVNLSIGGALSTAACDASLPTTASLVNQLLAAGVATVIAAGNNGSNTQVSMPGCVSNAITISATDDADVPAGFTNSNALTDFWAPGVDIDAPIPTGTNHGSKNGTSMATPHVVGALALLRECVDGNGVPITNAKAVSDLAATGVNVTRNGVTRKRINVLDAATRNVNNNDFSAPEVLTGNGPFNDFDFNVCADSEVGEPGPFSLDNSVWWTWTPSSSGTATVSTEDNGTFRTTFDTTLAVYTGNTLGTLAVVASNDDSGTGLRSLVRFPATAGTTYRIKVDGFGAANGLMNLHVDVGPPPACLGVVATIIGTPDPEVINGTAGNDVILAGNGDDTVNGLGGNDIICGGNGNDTINGGDGNDLLDGGPGNDALRGEAGVDTVSYASATAAVTASLTANAGSGGGGADTFVLVENVTGSAFHDVLVGNAGANVLLGQNGNDRLDGVAGNDDLQGGNGDDLLTGRLGNDRYHGGAGIDTANFSVSPAAVSASLLAGAASGEGTDLLVQVETMVGSAFNDVLTGNNGVNRLDGRGGKDRLRGLGAADTLLGAVGNDTILGGGGNDTARGGAGRDTLRGEGGKDRVFGDAGNDRQFGDAGNDTVNGGGGNDTLRGGAGKDTVRGDAGRDRAYGDAGNDRLVGGNGTDRCTGGTGVDTQASCEVLAGIP